MGVLVKELPYEKVVELRIVRDTVMAVALVSEEDVLRLICGYAPQSGGRLEEKQSFYDELKSGICIVEMIHLFAWVILIRTLVRILMDFYGVHEWNGVFHGNS